MFTEGFIDDCLDHCFSTLDAHYKKENLSEFDSDVESALFVSWYIRETELRGCLGSLNPIPLRDGLSQYSLSSALKDSRFSPLNRHEFEESTCTVNLLHTFQTCKSHDDWSLGEHGVIVEFGHYRATFLPKVPVEQGWSKGDTIRAALRKAGKSGRVEDLDECKVTKYLSSLSSLDFNEWTISKNGNVQRQAEQSFQDAYKNGINDINQCFFRIQLKIDLLNLSDQDPTAFMQVCQWKTIPRELSDYVLELLTNFYETQIHREQLLLSILPIFAPVSSVIKRKGSIDYNNIMRNNLVSIIGRLLGISSKLNITEAQVYGCMNDTGKNNTKVLRYRSTSESNSAESILVSGKGEFKCMVCGRILIELSPLRVKNCVRLAVLSFEESPNFIEVLIPDESTIDSYIGKQVCFTGRLRYALFNPNSLIKSEVYLDAYSVEEYPKTEINRKTLEHFLLEVTNKVDLEFALVSTIILLVLAKTAGKHITLSIQTNPYAEENIRDQIRMITDLFGWKLTHSNPKLKTSKVINKSIHEGYYFMNTIDSPIDCLTIGKKNVDIFINSSFAITDLNIEVDSIPLLAKLKNSIRITLPIMSPIADTSMFSDESILIKVVADICARFGGSAKVEYSHISEAGRILSNIEFDPKILQTLKAG